MIWALAAVVGFEPTKTQLQRLVCFPSHLTASCSRYPSWKFMLSFQAILLLAGCAGNPALPEVVKVPVPIACLSALPAAPDILPDAALFALDDYRAVLELARARIVLRDAVAERDALLQGCM